MADKPVSLTRGRRAQGGLSRDEVAAVQRERMLTAMADVVARNSYVGTSVADVIAEAGVSRETFYQQFDSKAACFSAAFDAAAAQLFGTLLPLQDTGSPYEQFDSLVTNYLQAIVEHENSARVFLIEVYAAGSEALARRAATQRRFVDIFARMLGAESDEACFACEALVASIGAMVTARLSARDTDGLIALGPKLSVLARTMI